MIRGTEAPFVIKTKFLGADIFAIKVTFWQPGNYGTTEQPLPIIKTRGHCTVISDSYEFGVKLSSSETARFLEDRKAYMQAIVTSNSGEIVANDQYDIIVEPMFNGGNTPTPDAGGIIILDGQTIK
jgi:hypothetical protein